MQCGTGIVVQRTHTPHPTAVVITALAWYVGDKRQPGRQQVSYLQVGGRVRTIVGDRNGKCNVLAQVWCGIVDGFRQPQVGLLSGEGGVVLVIFVGHVVVGRGVRVLLVGGADLGHVGDAGGGGNRSGDLQRLAAVGSQVTDAPDA